MAKLIDETGNRYTRLTVLSRAGSNVHNQATWLCECDCGNRVVVRGAYLRRGSTRSCGCYTAQLASERVIDEVGNRYGALVVLARRGSKRVSGGARAMWVCQCDCGEAKVIAGTDLRNGHVTSCGCGVARQLPHGIAARNQLLRHYRRGAGLRGVKWLLTDDDFDQLIVGDCHYCGIPPSRESGQDKGMNGKIVCNGIDRVDNDKGYTPDNCVPCCTDCNRMKRTMGHVQFLEVVFSIAAHQNYQLPMVAYGS